MSNVVILELGPLYTLEEVKAALNVDHSDDDVLIQSYMDAAQTAALQYCNINLVPQDAEAAFKVAAMMHVSAMYQDREGSFGLPLASRDLINPYRWLRV